MNTKAYRLMRLRDRARERRDVAKAKGRTRAEARNSFRASRLNDLYLMWDLPSYEPPFNWADFAAGLPI